MRRLSESCQGLSRSLPAAEEALGRSLTDALAETGLSDALMRLSVHGEGREGFFLLIIREFHSHPETLYDKGVRVLCSVERRPSARAVDTQIKSSQYTAGVLAAIDALETPAHETLFLDPDLLVAEGTVSNIFIVKEKRVLTPPARSGILRGVTREHVIALARRLGLAVEETPFTRHELYNAGECFLTNTSSEVLPVVSVDERRIGDGRPGTVSKLLRKRFRS